MQAQGNYALRELHLAAGLADCPAFQALCGVSGDTAAAGAASRIHFKRVLPLPANGDEYSLAEIQALRPYAVIWTQDSAVDWDASPGVGGHHRAGLRIRLCRNVPDELTEQQVDMSWDNIVGLILDQLLLRSGRAGFLAASYAIDPEGWYRSHPNDWVSEGDYQMAHIDARVG